MEYLFLNGSSDHQNGSIPQQPNQHTFSTPVSVLIIMVMTLLSISIIAGNIMVIYVYFKYKKLQVPKNYFILSLAIADVLIGIFSVNFYTLYLVRGRWPLGPIPCDLWLSMDYSCCQASTLGLLAISVDRYFSIRNAVFYRKNLTKERLKNILLALWVVSFTIWFGTIFLYPVFYGERTVANGVCHIQFLAENKVITIITAFVNFYGPIVLMTGIYICISFTLINRYKDLRERQKTTIRKNYFSRTIQNQSDSSSSLTPSNTEIELKIKTDACDRKARYSCQNDKITLITNLRYNQKMNSLQRTESNEIISNGLSTSFTSITRKRSTRRQKQYKTHKRAVTLLLLVILAFAITWLPYNLLAVIWPFCDKCIIDAWWHFAYIFCYVNSLLNPLCYAFGNRQFNKYFKKLFRDMKMKLKRP